MKRIIILHFIRLVNLKLFFSTHSFHLTLGLFCFYVDLRFSRFGVQFHSYTSRCGGRGRGGLIVTLYTFSPVET